MNFAVGTLVPRLQDFDNVYKPICQPTYVYIFARERNEVKKIKKIVNALFIIFAKCIL